MKIRILVGSIAKNVSENFAVLMVKFGGRELYSDSTVGWRGGEDRERRSAWR